MDNELTSHNETRLGVAALGLPSSPIITLEGMPWPLLICWLPQPAGVDMEGVFRELDPRDMLMLMGVRTLVGVRPVLPSMRASKLRLVTMLVGVSMGTPMLLMRFEPLGRLSPRNWGR